MAAARLSWLVDQRPQGRARKPNRRSPNSSSARAALDCSSGSPTGGAVPLIPTSTRFRQQRRECARCSPDVVREYSLRSFPRHRGLCHAALFWRCRRPFPPRPPAKRAAKAALPTASVSPSRAAALDRAARARSARTLEFARIRDHLPPKAHRFCNFAKVWVLQIRVHRH